jgi:hypothetical protein
MKSKNIKLLLLIGGLLVVNLFFWLREPSSLRTNYKADLFKVSDTSSIGSIVIKSGAAVSKITRSDRWLLNDQYSVDPSMLRILMNVLSQLGVNKPLSAFDSEEVRNSRAEWITVAITGAESSSFSVYGNPNRTKTYLIDQEDQVYEAEIVGYSDYLGGIFELSVDQWRDRRIFNGNWRSIQSITVDYEATETEDLIVRFKDKFFEVEGIAKVDSNALIDYLNEFEYLTANERISTGRFPIYDSLVETVPLATITIEDIYFDGKRSITFYPMARNGRIQLASDTAGDMVIFDKRRSARLLRKPSEFTYQP